MADLISIVIPARNAENNLADILEAVYAQSARESLDVVVVDDGSSDDTARVAESFPCRVLSLAGSSGNPALARNRGAAVSGGDPIIFLDSDCVPRADWLRAILASHAEGYAVVGGALDMPAGLSFSARCDYYCGCYLIHSGRPRAVVPHHPPPSLSFRREAFFRSGGFSERWPLYYTNEEREPLARLRESGDTLIFEPAAVVEHRNRPGWIALLKRHFRWGYTAVESKHVSQSTRWAWLYRWPLLTVALSPAFVVLHSAMIVGLWARQGVVEIILHAPFILISRVSYVSGMVLGALDWYRRSGSAGQGSTKRWAAPQ